MNLLRPGLLLMLSLSALATSKDDAVAAIRAEMAAQAQTWNAGDISGFLRSYAVDCTFVGKQVLHGRDALRVRYENTYRSKESMGTLSFSELDVRQLDPQVAIVTGKWRLDRTAEAGGPVGGIFSLVWQKRDGRWVIVLDHTA
jgi:uncharacterized protein (TIGR02246 family)